MVDINIDVLDFTLRGLRLLNEYSSIYDKVELIRGDLNLANYTSPECWLISLIADLFTFNLEEISDTMVLNSNLVFDKLKAYDSEVAYYYMVDFREQYDYTELDEDILTSKEFKNDFDEYFSNLGMRCLEFYSPLISLVSWDDAPLAAFIPNLIEFKFNLYGNVFIDCEIVKSEKNGSPNVFVYYIQDNQCDFADDIDVFELEDEFLSIIKTANKYKLKLVHFERKFLSS